VANILRKKEIGIGVWGGMVGAVFLMVVARLLYERYKKNQTATIPQAELMDNK
jgi:hypothetical protein